MAERELTITLLGNARGALDAMGRVDRQSQGLGRRLQGLGRTAGLAFAAGGVAAAGFAATAVKMAADFEASMAEVRTLLPDISDEAFGELRQGVLDLSKEMGIATNEAVPALYQAISAGVPTDNVMSFMEVASKAAIGGVTDLETAVDGITSVVNAYGEEVVSAQEAADVMFTGVKLGKTDFEELSQSLFNVIPTAASLGVGFEEVTAALATMTAQGTPTSVATTQLRQLFVEATKDTSDLSEAIEDMAGQSLTQLIKEGNDTSVVLDELRRQMPEDDFRNLFGSVEGLNAALAITGNNSEEMQSSMRAMGNSAGAVEQAFEGISETASFKLDRALNELKVMMLEFGSMILPQFVEVLDNEVLPALDRFSEWFDTNRPEIEGALNGISEVMGALAVSFQTGFGEVVFPLLQRFAQFLMDNKPLLYGLLIAVGVGLLFLVGPVAKVTIVIVGLTTAIGALIENWDELKEKVEQGIDWTKAQLTPPSLPGLPDLAAPNLARGFGDIMDRITNPFGRAAGGPVRAGMPYMVGEAGRPELFIPETDGMITPNVPQGRTVNVIQVYVSGLMLHTKGEITEAVMEAIDDGRRRGLS